MRFLQTSDWQLGLAIKQLGAKASEARELRLEAAQRALELARDEEVDFVLVAGDTFDSHEVDNLVVERAVEILSLVRRPVFVLPGNHDPLGAGGVWGRRAWQRRPENIILLDQPVEIALADGSALYPCPLSQKRSGADPTEWIPARREGDERIRIGVAHGSLGVMPKSANFPIALDRCETAGLEHLALGDWHGTKVVGRCAYSGTPEATSFSEKQTGQALLVRVDPDSREVEIETLKIGSLNWMESHPVVRGEADLGALREELEAPEDLSKVVLRVRARLEGDLPAALLEDLQDLRHGIEQRAFSSDWSVEASVTWEDELPAGLARDLDAALAAMSAEDGPAAPFQGFDGTVPEIAVEARSLLRRLAAETASGSVDSP